MTPPVAPRRPKTLSAHGDTRVDDWFWLRDRDNPEVVELLRSEDRYAKETLSHLEPLQKELFDEIKARIVETDLSVPVRKDQWWYFSRTVEGLSYPIHCRRRVSSPDEDPPDAREAQPGEEVLLDQNELASGHSYLAVGNFAISKEHRLLAYAFDVVGDERFTLVVRDLVTGEEVGDRIEGTSYGLEWANDEQTLFYTRPDEANRPYQLWRHKLQTDPADDELVLEEPDERFHLGVGKTKDDEYVVIELHSKITSEAHTIPARDPASKPSLLMTRRQGVEYSIEHYKGCFLVVTNDRAENFKLTAVPADVGMGRDAVELVASSDDVRIEGVDIFETHIAIYERREGMPRIRVVPLQGRASLDGPLPFGEMVPAPESPSSTWGGANPQFDSHLLRYTYSSLITPMSVYDLEMTSGRSVLRKRQPVLGGFETSDYATERLWANSIDNVRVPMSVVYRRGVTLDGSAPCLLYGYGSYEASMDPAFSSFRLSLLDRGFVFAIAHVRGGGEMGRQWYEQGKMLHKSNTFHDFIACARHLVDARYTNADRLVARGGSAGGLLMGAILNMAPQLFKAIVAEVPFVDCLTTIMDETLPLTVIEWEEWGNPLDDPQIYAAMKAYTPYDNVREEHHPDVLATTGLNDPRVGYWEPAKWIQKLRASDPKVKALLKVELDSGHAGPSGRYDSWKEEAFILSFVLDEVGRSVTS